VDGPDDIDQGSAGGGVGWPLVERRQARDANGDAPERRQRAADELAPAADGPITAPMWPFRLLALAGAFVEARHDLTWSNWELITALAVATVYAVTAILRPIPYRDDLRTRFRIVIELALHTALVLLTTAWSSPVAICLIPTAMLAGFASGTAFALQAMTAAVAVVTVQHLTTVDIGDGAQDAALWAGVLGVVAFTSGLTQRASADAARQQHAALERVNRLAEANSLLFALQRVAQSMPASLDLDDIADTTLKRVRSLVPGDTVSLYLGNDAERRLEVFRNSGGATATTISLDAPPSTIRSAIDAPRTLRLTTMPAGAGLGTTSRSGVYAALRARGNMVGLLAVESDQPEAFTQQHSEIVHGLAEPFGIAIDNARLFRQLRSASANEERRRIARDLHDQVGSSLAFLGFEVDRATHLAAQGEPMEATLTELRGHLTTVINDIRETLHDLRTDVTDERDLPATLREHLARVTDRRRLATELDVDATFRPPRQVERELWQIALEAITNVEKHAQATTVRVSFTARENRAVLRISDDGIGLNTSAPRADRYGMVGMRERAEGIGASLRVESPASGGTSVTVTFDRVGSDTGEAGS
jgi:signal transduction histidine kinase